jgi:tRNA(His) 5'-end guanylyltransferase
MKVQTGLTLTERMKKFEDISKYHLTPKQPIMVKLIAKNFTQFVSQPGIEQFDKRITGLFMRAGMKVCEDITQVEYGYHSSKEIVFLLKDYRTKKQDQYFNGSIQEINSLITSKFTYWFNKHAENTFSTPAAIGGYKPVEFTCKVFSLPLHEVTNYFISQQRQSVKSIINNIANKMFTPEELLYKKTGDKIIMIKENNGTDWETIEYNKGIAIKKIGVELPVEDLTEEEISSLKEPAPETITRIRTIVDVNPRLFSEYREDIENIVYSGEGVLKPATQLQLNF